MSNKARTLRDVLLSGDMCPYCRSTDTETQDRNEERDYRCPDCGFEWDADGIDVPKDQPLPPQL